MWTVKAARELRARRLIIGGLKDNYTKDISRQNSGSSQEWRPLDSICWKCTRSRNNQADTEGGSTHVAVAANISCLFAFVHTLSAAAKRSVNTIIRQIFNALCPVTKYRTADGPTSKATVLRTRTRRTTMSMRRLLYKCKWSSSVFFLCSSDVKIFYRFRGIRAGVRIEIVRKAKGETTFINLAGRHQLRPSSTIPSSQPDSWPSESATKSSLCLIKSDSSVERGWWSRIQSMKVFVFRDEGALRDKYVLILLTSSS